jgi:hypothetical protein
MGFVKFVGAAATVAMMACGVVACSSGAEPSPQTGSDPAPTAPTTQNAANDGITLTTGTPQRITGSYRDAAGDSIQFDLAKVNDDIFADVTGNGGRPILHIQTDGDDYNFSYMGGSLTMHTTKTFVAQARAQNNPSAVSTDGFAWTGDMNVLDDMLKLPEVAQFPILSRALGVRGFTGSDFPAVLVLHKVAQQAAQALSVNVPTLASQVASEAYCQAYPNQNNGCYGMCGPKCTCWSWVCGDCCYHYGCAVHDDWCRDGKWWYCYNITAVITLFGC